MQQQSDVMSSLLHADVGASEERSFPVWQAKKIGEHSFGVLDHDLEMNISVMCSSDETDSRTWQVVGWDVNRRKCLEQSLPPVQ